MKRRRKIDNFCDPLLPAQIAEMAEDQVTAVSFERQPHEGFVDEPGVAYNQQSGNLGHYISQAIRH